MRIILDLRTACDHFPGIGRYAYQLAARMADLQDRDELLLTYNPGSDNGRFDFAGLGSKPGVQLIPTGTLPITIREQILFPLELRRMRPDIIHFPYQVVPLLAPRPVVITIHDVIPLRLPHYFTARRLRYYRLSLSLALRSASSVICLSEATRADLLSLFPYDSTRLHVIHSGVSDSFRPCTKDQLQRVREAYGLPGQYLLYVGSNKPHKNLPALIDAYALLKDAPPLVVAGLRDLRYKQDYERVEVLGLKDRVFFAGAIEEPDLPALYSGALAFVFPSTYEGFGLPPLEAMACGAPVACSDIPSLRETAGNAALLFDAEDSRSIAAALERLIRDENLRADLRERGLRRAAEMNWDDAAKKTLGVYNLAAKAV